MKNTLVLFLLFASITGYSQVYPFTEGFSGAPGGLVPPGWGGDVTVANGHGPNGISALSVYFYMYPQSANAITPLIGPLTSHSLLSFTYRIMDQSGFPFSGATTFGPGDTFSVQVAANGAAYQTVFQLNDSNQIPIAAFIQHNVYLGPFAGDTVRIQFAFVFGGNNSGYYVDIDTVFVEDNPSAAIAEINSVPQVSIFPNPTSSSAGCRVVTGGLGANQMEVFDALGRAIYYSKFTGHCELPVANWSAGLYFVQLGDENGRITRKLVVQ